MQRIVFLHGYLEDAGMWKPLMHKLSLSKYTVQFPEIPGHGQRRDIRVKADMESYIDDIFKQINPAPEDKIFMVGHSMGGYITAGFAEKYGSYLSAVCLFQSKCDEDDAAKKEGRDRAMAAARENHVLYVRTMITSLVSEHHREAMAHLIEPQIQYAQSLSVDALVDALTVMKNRKSQLETFKQRRFSLYYFLGENDPAIPLHVAMQEIQDLPGAMWHMESDIGHLPQYERPMAASEFLQRIVRAELG